MNTENQIEPLRRWCEEEDLFYDTVDELEWAQALQYLTQSPEEVFEAWKANR